MWKARGGVALAIGLGPVGVLALSEWVRRRGSRGVRLELAGLRADVGVVLGARLGDDGRVTGMLEDRLIQGLTALEGGIVPRLLVSGLAPEANAMASWLGARGIDPARVTVDARSPRTIDTMRRAAAEHGVKRALLCTQRFHLPRALLLAERHGIDAVGVPCDRRAYRRQTRNELREVAARARAAIDLAFG